MLQDMKNDRVRVHGRTLNRQGSLYLPSKFKSKDLAPWCVEKMASKEIWVLRPRDGASVYFTTLKQALFVAEK